MTATAAFLGAQIGTGIISNLTAAQWTAEDYVLSKGVIGIESDTGKWKIGDGSTTWTSLGYVAGGQVGTTLMTTPVSTVAVAEFGDGRDITTVLTLTDFIVGAIPSANAALGVGNIVASFPAGQHLELVYSFSALNLKVPSTGKATKTGLGSVVASGAVSVLSGTATFQDRLSGQDITTSATGGTAVSAIAGATAGIGTGIALNGTGSVKNVFLNAAATWVTGNAGNLTASGIIVIHWTRMG